MPIYFLVFLATLAVTVLLYVIAIVVAVAKRGSFPSLINRPMSDGLQAMGLALLWWNVGAGWLLLLAVYPIHVDMHLLGESALQAFSRGYTSRLPIVVLPYGFACLAWAAALWSTSTRFTRQAIWVIATLCVISVAASPFAANAQGDMQENGFTNAAYTQLMYGHVVRTVAMSLAAMWALIQSWQPSGTIKNA